MTTKLAGRLGALLAAAAFALSACGPAATPSPSAVTTFSPGGEGTTVDVTLQEFAVVPSVASATAGDVTFNLTNSGPDDPHEFVIIKTDLDAGALPTDENGAVDEAGEGIEVIDEVEEIEVGATAELTATLEAGNYVLICNIWDEDEQEAHYQKGMHTAFTVN
jgi:uncharacterized cupredoxin-like copper-binding protein